MPHILILYNYMSSKELSGRVKLYVYWNCASLVFKVGFYGKLETIKMLL